jgi:hypothetical protein
VSLINNGRKWLDTEGHEAEGRISYRKGLAIALEAFREVGCHIDEDIDTALVAEYTFLSQELESCAAKDKIARASLSTAIEDVDGAFLALKVTNDEAGYRCVDQALSHHAQFRYKNMPKDAFHVACQGHKTRILNILKSPGINLAEKELLECRCANVVTAQGAYLRKQQKITGGA